MTSRRWSPLLLLTVVGALSVEPGYGDAPLRPPHRHTACSPSQRICVTSDPKEGTFAHRPETPSVGQALWTLPRWHRVLFIADDGRHLITGYNGVNLVPRARPEQTVVAEFWRDGTLLESYTLRELGYSADRLEPTVSHYSWGHYVGLGSDGLFRLRMVDAAVLVFDPTSGTLVRREP